jgi:thymidylate kinase
MKLLIIEGPDRCGKNTLIKNLVSQAENSVVRHFGSAKGKDDLAKRDYQFSFFNKEFQLAANRQLFSHPDTERYPRDLWIWNRAHLGEFVYGKMYRDTHPEEWVFQLEKQYAMDIDSSVYLLLLTAPSEFLCSREDGQSFSADVNKKQEEQQRFFEAYEESFIRNKMILNVSQDAENYRTPESILEDVNKFLRFV